AVADRLAQAGGLGEVLDGPSRRVAVAEAGALEAAVVDAAPVAQEVEGLRAEVADADGAQQAGSRPREHGGQRSQALADDRRHLAPGETPVTSNVVDARQLVAHDVL